MGRSKRYPVKGGSIQKRRLKMRPQDPCNPKGPIHEDEGTRGHIKDKNWDGSKDPDIVVGSFADNFGPGMVGLLPGAALESASSNAQPVSKREKRRRKCGQAREPRRPSKLEGDGRPKGAATADSSVGTAWKSEKQAPMPKQKPGESSWAYNRRIDQHVREQLNQASKKLNTDHSRGRKRKQAEAKKQFASEKAARKMGKTDQDGLFRRTEKVTFGDVVERPPVMSADAMKSQAKLKASAAGVQAPQANVGGCPPELQDYAAKVRAAYAEMKKKRASGR